MVCVLFKKQKQKKKAKKGGKTYGLSSSFFKDKKVITKRWNSSPLPYSNTIAVAEVPAEQHGAGPKPQNSLGRGRNTYFGTGLKKRNASCLPPFG